MLQKPAQRDAQLKSQLAPVKAFFAYRTPAAKKDHPKQKSKKDALEAEKQADAQASSNGSAPQGAPSTPSTPSNGSAAPTDAGAAAPSNGATTHAS